MRPSSFAIHLSVFIAFACAPLVSLAEPSLDEESTISLFESQKARITRNDDGNAIKLFSPGKPPHLVEELQYLSFLKHLEQLALNAPEAGDNDWEFLHELPNLKRFTIWHGKEFSSLAPFCDLPIEALTVGGCMGIRDLNKEEPEKQRDAILTLTGLPNLTYLNLYHSPLAPTDAHLAHIAEQFPKLVELRLDFSAPRGFETTTTPAGLAALHKLPLETLILENISTFTPDHMVSIAGIETLKSIVIDMRKKPFDADPLVEAIKRTRPGLFIQTEGSQPEEEPKDSQN